MNFTTASREVLIRKTKQGILVKAVEELDLTTTPTLEQALMASVEATIRSTSTTILAVDLRQVNFIDSAGLALLVRARKVLSPAACSLQVLLTPGQQPERVLRLGRFDAIMTLVHNNTFVCDDEN